MRKYVKVAVPLSADSEVLVAENSLETLGLAEGVVFDFDGVLVDSRESYGKAVTESARYVLGSLGLRLPADTEVAERVDEIRSTGYFNNSVDVARMLLLLSFLGLPEAHAHRLGQAIAAAKAGGQQTPAALLGQLSSTLGFGGLEVALPRLSDLAKDGLGGQTYQAFRKAFEQALRAAAEKRGLGNDYDLFSWFVGETGAYGEGLVETVFSDMYYGPLVAEFKKKGPFFVFGEPLYTRERRCVRPETLRRLSEMFGQGRLALVTGRNRRLAKLALGELYGHFNDQASVFIADEIMEGAPPTIQKPSPYGIIKSASTMGLPTVIYVGDSVEDLLMAHNASSFGVNTVFVGVTGLCNDPARARNTFASMGADVIVESVDSLPFLVEEAKSLA